MINAGTSSGGASHDIGASSAGMESATADGGTEGLLVMRDLAGAYGGSCRGRFRWLAAGVVTALLSPAALPLTCGKTVCSAVARNTISTIYLLCSDNDEAANLLARALISRIPTHLYCRPRPR